MTSGVTSTRHGKAGRSRRGQRSPAATLPIARVYVDVPLAHLDRPFDYLVPAQLDDSAQHGVRLRVRFAGRLVDGWLLDRVERSDHAGRLGWIERVVSPEPVLSPQVAALARAVADRCAGTMNDVLRLAVPPRHARAEAGPGVATAATPARPTVDGWRSYPRGPAFMEALHQGRAAHACWQALPGEDWPARLAEAAVTVAATGRGAVLVVPDHRDTARLHAAIAALAGPDAVVTLAAGVGPEQRYRQWLAVRRGAVRIVVGTRAAAFAPVADLGLMVLWDDGDDLHAEPRAPYPHTRLVLGQRAVLEGAALLVAGRARTAETQLSVETGWAHEIVAARDVVRAAAPRITAIGEDDAQLARDPMARAARLPTVAFDAARAALSRDRPVLVQVPRRGYVPALACGQCRAPARCRRCAGPLGLPVAGEVACRWCGAPEARYSCPACGDARLRAAVTGARRTAEELGRAFAGVTLYTSGGGSAADRTNAGKVLADIPPGPSLVIATPGAEPLAEYGAALLLDAAALLGRSSLRAAEEALRRWMAAAAMVEPATHGGRVVVVAEASLRPVQALIRWDAAGHASAELAARAELGFPPAVRMAALDGAPETLASLEFPDRVEVLGPVAVPGQAEGARERVLLRVPRADGSALVTALAALQAERSARKATDFLRVELDPQEVT
ncbi:MAG: primosomal protein N' [Pseudonocardiales bacterium]|nr:primosomal protein N' [Pseudonocardiales bacterium]